MAEGLTCLIKVGAEADQNYQNYILREGGVSGGLFKFSLRSATSCQAFLLDVKACGRCPLAVGCEMRVTFRRGFSSPL
ncbi:hypothetical protein PO909_009124 [Leuciscus waleckii]